MSKDSIELLIQQLQVQYVITSDAMTRSTDLAMMLRIIVGMSIRPNIRTLLGCIAEAL